MGLAGGKARGLSRDPASIYKGEVIKEDNCHYLGSPYSYAHIYVHLHTCEHA